MAGGKRGIAGKGTDLRERKAEGQRLTRRALLKRLGLGTAAAVGLTYVQPSLGSIGVSKAFAQGRYGPTPTPTPTPTPGQPYITPTSGGPGSPFTIYDPGGRIMPYDIVVFYPAGTDPALGNLAANVAVSADGKTLTGYVAPAALIATPHYVAVRPSLTDPSRFNDLAFLVTA